MSEQGPLASEVLREIGDRWAKVTGGKWSTWNHGHEYKTTYVASDAKEGHIGVDMAHLDAEAIAHAPEDIKHLLGEVTRIYKAWALDLQAVAISNRVFDARINELKARNAKLQRVVDLVTLGRADVATRLLADKDDGWEASARTTVTMVAAAVDEAIADLGDAT